MDNIADYMWDTGEQFLSDIGLINSKGEEIKVFNQIELITLHSFLVGLLNLKTLKQETIAKLNKLEYLNTKEALNSLLSIIKDSEIYPSYFKARVEIQSALAKEEGKRNPKKLESLENIALQILSASSIQEEVNKYSQRILQASLL